MYCKLEDDDGNWIDNEVISDGVCDRCKTKYTSSAKDTWKMHGYNIHDIPGTIHVPEGEAAPEELCSVCKTRELRNNKENCIRELIRDYGIPSVFAQSAYIDIVNGAVYDAVSSRGDHNLLITHSVADKGEVLRQIFKYICDMYLTGHSDMRAINTEALLHSPSAWAVSDTLYVYDLHITQGETRQDTSRFLYKLERFITQRYMSAPNSRTVIATHVSDTDLQSYFPNAYWILHDQYTTAQIN